ncbi:MAG TPA: HDOD domain-containing protein [Firmicutes bacterium]|nr:HDOD domain-containing protein [Bacillota bacterium]
MALTWIVAIIALCLVFIVFASYIVFPENINAVVKEEDDELEAEPEEVPDATLPESVAPSFAPIPLPQSCPTDEEFLEVVEEVSVDLPAEIPISVTADFLTINEISPERLESLELVTSNMPEIPRVAMQLMPILSKPGAGAKEIAAIIERDQTSAARLLRWVNSSFYGLESKVESLHRAVALLGMDTVRSAVLQAAFEQHATNISIKGLAGNTIWRHASAVAIIAKEFARQVKGVEPDVAATAGLLHDIGLLLMLVMEKRGIQEATESSQASAEPLVAHEDKIIGFNHQVMGECFIRSWRLPEIIAEAVGRHHTPLKDGFDPLAGVLWLADYIASRLDFPCPLHQVMIAQEDELNEFLKLLGLRPPLDKLVTDGLLRQIVANTHFWSAENVSTRAGIGLT